MQLRQLFVLLTVMQLVAASNVHGQSIVTDDKIEIVHTPTGIGNLTRAISVDATGSGSFQGAQISYNASGTEGLGFYAPTGVNQGVNVGDAQGIPFSPVNASAFNVSSDRRLKTDLETIAQGNSEIFVEQFRAIETVTFRYKWETLENDQNKHIGVIAQSLPPELVSASTVNADGSGGESLFVRLSDWLGLVTVTLQQVDRKVTTLEHSLQLMQTRNQLLEEENQLLRTRLASLAVAEGRTTLPPSEQPE